MTLSKEKNVVIIGGGPGGYSAGFRAAELGLKVKIIDLEGSLGGVCLKRGCIPSKALLRITHLIEETKEAQRWGMIQTPPSFNFDQLRQRKKELIDELKNQLHQVAKNRNIEIIPARASFLDDQTLILEKPDKKTEKLSFDSVILATGSRPVIPSNFILESRHLWTSNQALELDEIPKKILIVGGGYIGLELGQVYASFGSEITLVEKEKTILPDLDQELTAPLLKKTTDLFKELLFETEVQKIETGDSKVKVTFLKNKESSDAFFDKILIATGRKPNSSGLGLENTKAEILEGGFLKVDSQQRTAAPHIFAVGDLTGSPLLAHKAMYEGKVAAEVIAGLPTHFEPLAIPAVIYTDPEIAWTGLSEAEAKLKGIKIRTIKLPWGYSGKAKILGRENGLTKLILNPETERIMGVGMVGSGSSELIGEATLAIEMGATLTDLRWTIHPHPTLSEVLSEM